MRHGRLSKNSPTALKGNLYCTTPQTQTIIKGMKFTLSAQLSPSGPFGVPQDKYTVVPTEPRREFHGPVLDTRLGKIVGYGSMSAYRGDGEAIRETLKVDKFEVRLSDNYVFIEVESDDNRDALSQCQEFLDRFLIQLSVRLRRSFSYEILGLTDEQNQRYSTPVVMHLINTTTYNLDQLRQAIHAAAEASKSLDDRLDRASQYFEHAIFLYEKRQELTRPGTRHYSALISSVFLSLAKAATILVGDPSRDRDHQRRYKKFGLDCDFYKNKIKRVLDLRDDYDVAHYDLTGRRAEVIEQNYGEALETTSTILARYSEHLKRKE